MRKEITGEFIMGRVFVTALIFLSILKIAAAQFYFYVCNYLNFIQNMNRLETSRKQ